MRERFLLFVVLILSISIMLPGCSILKHFRPQKSVQVTELNDPSLEKRLLIASLSSEFKNAVVERIKEEFRNEAIYMKFTGIEQLGKENGDDYSAAVVIVDSCMNWKIESHIKGFLRRHEDQSNVVILVMFDENYGEPKTKRYNLDAISAASEMHRVDEVAGKITAKIRVLLQKG